MPQLFSNNARALLVSGINETATSLVIEAAKADLFPTANTGTASLPAVTDWFKITLQDTPGNVEIMYVRTRTAGSGVLSNVLRGQEGTTARAFTAGTVVGLRITALDVQTALGVFGQDNTFTGSNTFTEPIVASAGLIGNATSATSATQLVVETTSSSDTLVYPFLAANLATGAQAAILDGALRYDCNANVLMPGSVDVKSGTYRTFVGTDTWSIRQSGTTLLFEFNGMAVFSIASNGALTSANNITAYSVP